jgi:hypothetical protein
MKAKRTVDSEGREYGYRINCPGCVAAGLADDHVLHTGTGPRPRWTFNGDAERPTFSPSLLVTYGRGDLPPLVCHSFITDGRIQFLSDCTHPLVGQTVDLPDIDKR